MMTYIIIPVYVLLNVVVFWRFYVWLTRAVPAIKNHRFLSFLLGLAYLILMALPILGVFLKDSGFRFFCMAFGNIFMGTVAFFGMAVLIVPCILYVLIKITERDKSKRRQAHMLRGKKSAWTVLLVSAAFTFGINLYGMDHADNTIVKRYAIHIDKKAGGVKSLRMMLLGDLHMSVNSYPEMYERMAKMVNEENPDIIVMVGDYFTSTYAGLKDPEKYIAALKKMHAPMGCYGVYGNHDVNEPLLVGFPIVKAENAVRSPEMDDFLKKSGITMLNDEVITIAAGSIQLAGRMDGERYGDGKSVRKKASDLLKGIDKEKPVIVLEHEPWEFAALCRAGADLALSGHTHNGQIFPGNIIVKFFNENGYGYEVVNGLRTLVTGGVGYYGPPLRIGTTSEITVIDLEFD